MPGSRFSVIVPAFRAEAFIARSIGSLVHQTCPDWEALIIADDGVDYQGVLAGAGIRDRRCRFLSTGRTGAGASAARNVGLDHAQSDWIAILDADDRMRPGKLALCKEALGGHGLVSCALQVLGPDLRPLRQVAEGADRVLSARTYKFTNLSMDSMLAYDRRRADPRYDKDLPCLTDLDLAMKLFGASATCFHLGAPLHDYVKQPQSISNQPGASSAMLATKQRLLRRLREGRYRFADNDGAQGFIRFLELSLGAESAYETALRERPGLLFEDHLEPRLRAAEAGSSA